MTDSAFDRARAGAAGFWRWWLGELAGLLPRGPLPFSRGARHWADIRPHRDRVEIIRFGWNGGEKLVDRTPLDALDGESWAEMAALTRDYHARIVLVPPLVHILTLRLPKEVRPHLASAIPLQLRDAAPVDPARLTWRVLDVAANGTMIDVRVALARTALIDQLVDGLATQGAAAPPILAEADDRQVMLRSRDRVGLGLGAPWIVALGLLAVTPLCILLALTILLAAKRSEVAALEQRVGPRIELARTVRARHDAAQALDHIVGLPTLSGVAAELAQHLPSTATVHSLDRAEDGTFSITLDAADPDVVRPALAGDRHSAALRETDQSKTPDGRFLIHYQGVWR
jgi:hypothetical protein